jgi:LysR family transcriptional regulator, glycine cleavage system transcriptional activator
LPADAITNLPGLARASAMSCFTSAAGKWLCTTRASAELHLTQAAVSRQIIGLEQRLGTALFARERAALQLTDAGRAFLGDITPALQALERATAGVMALKGKGGPLNLSVASSLGNHWLIPRLPQFTQAHADITLNMATRVGPADFGAGRLDISLEYGDGQRPGLTCEFLMPLTVSPCASPAWVRQHGKTLGPHTAPSQLIQHTTAPQAWARWFAKAAITPPVLTDGPRHDLMSMTLNAALVGLGVALLPDFMCASAVAARRLVRLSPLRVQADAEGRGYWLVLSPAAHNKPSVLAFAAWLRQHKPN